MIDPLLRELGWDTEDPHVVRPEYQSGHGRADYALLGDGKPMMIVEAKSLGTPLQDAVVEQGISYCSREGADYFTITDGQRWEIYVTDETVPVDENRVVEFDLKDSLPAEVCLMVLGLWRLVVQSPSPWHPLPQITPVKGKKPVGLRFPDGAVVQIQNWNHLMTEPTRWLIDNGHLTPKLLPIPGSGDRYLVSETFTHSDGKPMVNGKEVSGVWVETNFNSDHCILNAVAIIRHAGQVPAHFGVRFS